VITETAPPTSAEVAEIFAGDYLNKLSGERIEFECRRKLDEGYRKLLLNFSQTEIVNSIGISILLGVIDIANRHNAEIVFSDVNEHTIELFDLLGVTKHVAIQ